jgi:propanol-preferring alcohol dehydrogenase
MLACVLHRTAPVSSRPLKWEQAPDPQPRAGEVLIRVRACGVCRTDLHVIEGELQVRKSPLIPGHQVVGEVIRAAAAPACAFASGERVGVAWLNCTCGTCRFCAGGRENLCERAEFTGWTRDGGYAELIAAPADFIYRLPQSMSDQQIAPLLCAGIVGWRCLNQCDLAEWRGARIGLYGFGAAAHIGIQIARHRGAQVFVFTRDRLRHQKLAHELGATWVGDTFDATPVKLDAAIIYAAAGEIVPAALKALDRGGRLVLAGIHMSDVPPLKYQDLYWERRVQSVANNTRADGREFLEEAAAAKVMTSVQTFAMKDANDALIALKSDAIKGAAVLLV